MKQALDIKSIKSTLQREGAWTTKSSTTVFCEEVFVDSVQLSTTENDIPQFTDDQAAKLKHNFNSKVRDTAKTHIADTFSKEHVSHVNTLDVQGKSLSLVAQTLHVQASYTTWTLAFWSC